MLVVLFIYLFFEIGLAAEVDLKVTHDSEDGEPTIFSFKCSVEDYDENRVASISLYRQVSSSGDDRSFPREQIAYITALTPDSPQAGAGFDKLTLHGQIDFESNPETYLEVLFTDLTVDDLGLYTCEVSVVDEDGEVTFPSAEAIVAGRGGVPPRRTEVVADAATTTEGAPIIVEETTVPAGEMTAAVQETPLAPEETTVPAGETTAAVQETTIAPEETTVSAGETTAAVQETTVAPEETTPAKEETTVAPEETTTAQPLVTSDATSYVTTLTSTETTLAVEEALVTSDATSYVTTVTSTETTLAVEESTTPVEEITTAAETTPDVGVLEDSVVALEERLDTFNETVLELEKRVAALDAKDEGVTETTPAPAESDVSDYFVYENATYMIIRGGQDADANTAQTACESNRFYLTEVNSEGELQAIEDEISPYIIKDAVVLVAGQKEVNQDVWLYQTSKEQVDFFAWGPGEPAPSLVPECMALRMTGDRVTMVAVPCSRSFNNVFILCEHDD